jgi:hypothetical protein
MYKNKLKHTIGHEVFYFKGGKIGRAHKNDAMFGHDCLWNFRKGTTKYNFIAKVID